MGVSGYKQLTAEKKLTIDRLLERGLSYTAIAAELSIDQSTVGRWVRRKKEGPRKQKRFATVADEFDHIVKTARQIQTLHDIRWMSNRAICETMQIPMSRLRQLYREAKVEKHVVLAEPCNSDQETEAQRK